MSVVTVKRSRLAPVSRRFLRATFTRRAWADLVYVIAGLPLAVAGFAANVIIFVNPILIALSTPAMRKLGEGNRFLARRLAGEQVPPPPPMRCEPHVHLRTPDPARASVLITAHGGRVRHRSSDLKITGMPSARPVELAAAENLAVSDIRSHLDWFTAALYDMRGFAVQAADELACRPGSVHPLTRAGGHPSGTAITDSFVRFASEHRAGRPQALAQEAQLPFLTSLQVGFTKPPQSPAALVVSYTTAAYG